MKYALISDIHSNLQALKAALKVIEVQGVDKIVCLGDIVGYNANPSECVDLVREKADVVIQGNHDNMVVTGIPYTGIRPHARSGLEYSASQLSDEQSRWLEELPKVLTEGEFLAVHGHPSAPFEYMLYHSDAASAIRVLKRNHQYLCFFGHSHRISHAYTEGDSMKFYLNDPKRNNPYRERVIDVSKALKGKEYILLNCGAVGQPRSHNPNSFGVFDSDKAIVEIIEFEYDYQSAMDAILKADYEYVENIAKRLNRFADTLVNRAWSAGD